MFIFPDHEEILAQYDPSSCGLYFLQPGIHSSHERTLSRTSDAQTNLQQQFDQHKCQLEDSQ